MAIIKKMKIFNGSSWVQHDFGVEATNVAVQTIVNQLVKERDEQKPSIDIGPVVKYDIPYNGLTIHIAKIGKNQEIRGSVDGNKYGTAFQQDSQIEIWLTQVLKKLSRRTAPLFTPGMVLLLQKELKFLRA